MMTATRLPGVTGNRPTPAREGASLGRRLSHGRARPSIVGSGSAISVAGRRVIRFLRLESY